MSRSRDRYCKEIADRESPDERTAVSDHSKSSHTRDADQRVHPRGKPTKRLASRYPREHDSEAWHVCDDWPEFVPITLDEVEVMEAFLRDALDELLR